MITAAFDYVKANSVDEALRLLQESGGEAKLLAGGHSLLPLMKMRLTSPARLIDISGLQELRGISKDGDRVVIGALTTHRELAQSPIIQEYAPVLAEAAGQVGDIQVRNRGTIGGNLAHADPSSDLPAAAIALDAELTAITPDGKVVLSMDGYFLGPLLTALPPDSVLASVSFKALGRNAKGVYQKYPHPASGYAVVGVAAVAATDGEGRIEAARIGISGAADAPYRALAVESVLAGQKPSEALIEEAASHAADDGEIAGDLFASVAYRRHLCRVYTARALRKVLL
jgi:carbon-monoxide dehydrogenase medium subunit